MFRLNWLIIIIQIFNMKRRIFFLVFIIFCVCVYTRCSKSTNYNNSNPPPVTTATVNINGMAFSPSTLTVKTGTTVTWKNNDATTHTATSDDGSTFNTGNILSGYSATALVSQTGTFTYHCNIHSTMTATLVVTP